MSTQSIRRAAAAALVVLLAWPAPPPATAAPPAAPGDAAILHALHRLTFGPRPGDVEAVRAMGLEAWTDRQLRPERIDDSAVEGRLRGLKTLGLSTKTLMEGYDLPRDARRAIQQRRAELGEDASEAERRRARRELVREYGGRMEGSPRQVVNDLQEGRLIRAVYSERQLDEVLVDFWMNHFNVFAGKGPVRFLLPEYERDVIRPRAWGRFEDLLSAVAKSPAMLFYLDNWLSVDPDAASRTPRRRGGNDRRRGLNENYARELMELHTLGVDGGYTQHDVTEVARAFTGWTIRGLRQQDPRFAFDARLHDGQARTILGQRIPAGGAEQGQRVLHLLATHPSTARFIARKLARRFVADEPPPALVARAAETFRATDGDIRSVVRTIVTSPELAAAAGSGSKVKTPFEFVASALRASGAEVAEAGALARRLAGMGMPLYQAQPPTGYKDTAEAWVSTSGLLARLNLAVDLAGGRVPGVRVDPSRLAGTRADPSAAPAVRLFAQPLSDSTRQTLARETRDDASASRLAGLLLGSPEFQRR